MADPFGSNISQGDANRIDLADPLFSKGKIAQRTAQLRTDVDGIVGVGVTEGNVRTALAASAGTVALNNQTITAVGTVDGVDISTSNAVLTQGVGNVDLSSGAVSKDMQVDGAVWGDVTGHATNEFTITNPLVGGLLIIAEDGTALIKLKIAGGAALTLTTNKVSTLIVLSATTAAVIAEK